jgi:hypothetical protein
MKKPLNNFAYAVWALALFYFLLLIPETIELFRQPGILQSSHDANYIASFITRDIFGLLRNTVSGCGALLAYGAIIELIDRIRWNALPPEQRENR